MPVADDVLQTLRTWRRLRAGELVQRLGISRATLMRAIRDLGPQVAVRGKARRTTYAARRTVRGSMDPLPWYRVDPAGGVAEIASLYPLHPQGCAVEWRQGCEWPLDGEMQEGWFDGLPYMVEDMRPAGFLGRNFARLHGAVLQVSADPREWSEDDVLQALAILGSDLPGCYILGEAAMRAWLARSQAPPLAIADDALGRAYPPLADAAMAHEFGGSSAGGEFPKFTAVRQSAGALRHVIVKFSGSDASAGTERWSDLLVCEQLASHVVREQLGLDAAESVIVAAGGRTFLEVRRFDRHAGNGRSPVCSWAALDAGLFGLGGRPWTVAAGKLHERGLVDHDVRGRIERLWHFGQLIANDDMHAGNLGFRPGLQLAPVYDMLPMLYAPQRGVELPQRRFAPAPPLPSERKAWAQARAAAETFWSLAAADARISPGFRAICAVNAGRVAVLA